MGKRSSWKRRLSIVCLSCFDYPQRRMKNGVNKTSDSMIIIYKANNSVSTSHQSLSKYIDSFFCRILMDRQFSQSSPQFIVSSTRTEFVSHYLFETRNRHPWDLHNSDRDRYSLCLFRKLCVFRISWIEWTDFLSLRTFLRIVFFIIPLSLRSEKKKKMTIENKRKLERSLIE